MRKIIPVSVLLFIVFAPAATPAWQESFDGVPQGKLPAGWVISGDAEAMVVENPDGGRCLAFTKRSITSNSPALSIPIPTHAGSITFSMKFQAQAPETITSLLLQDKTGFQWAFVNLVNGNLSQNQMLGGKGVGVLLGGYTATGNEKPKSGGWSELRLCMNLERQTFDAWVDGRRTATNVGFWRPERRYGETAKLALMLFRQTTGMVYLDDIAIWHGEVLPETMNHNDGAAPRHVASEASVAKTSTWLPQWGLANFMGPIKTESATIAPEPKLQAFWIEGLPLRGKPTRFFAYLGLPEVQTGKVPAVVLVHGGGGTATADWVRAWTAKGYAALAMDNEGQIPQRMPDNPKRWMPISNLGLPFTGAPQRTGPPFADYALPDDEQWAYHAVASVIRSATVLSSRPEVDASRLGVVGISWGSVLCSLAAGVDARFKFVVPQYIGGHHHLGNVWYAFMKDHPETLRWDPALFYTNLHGRSQWLWINGANDNYGLPPMTDRSWKTTAPDSWMCLLPTLGHATLFGEAGPNAVREIYAFADSVTKGAPGLARILSSAVEKGALRVRWKTEVPVQAARWCFTTEAVPTVSIGGEKRKDWPKVKYRVDELPLPAVKNHPDGSQEAVLPIPESFKAGFLNLVDARGLTVTCGLVESP